MSEETGDNGRFFELLAMHVASGKAIRDSAELIGCSERQGYRISSTPEFRQRVSDIRSAALDAATGEITSAACEAVATIRELLGSTNEPSVRLNAAKAIVNALGPLSEIGELRSRLDALEQRR